MDRAALSVSSDMGKHLERRLCAELAARTRITNALICWYATLSEGEQQTSRGERIGQKVVLARKKEQNVRNQWLMHRKKK